MELLFKLFQLIWWKYVVLRGLYMYLPPLIDRIIINYKFTSRHPKDDSGQLWFSNLDKWFIQFVQFLQAFRLIQDNLNTCQFWSKIIKFFDFDITRFDSYGILYLQRSYTIWLYKSKSRAILSTHKLILVTVE